MSTGFGMGRVALTVNDLASVTAFYRDVVGLHVLSADAAVATLGVEGTVLLELRRDAAARRRSPREAGLFHTAFLLPTRADLGRWTRHAAEIRAPVSGASDHLVSEAIYLDDPEGNGVEIYADRPQAVWQWSGGEVKMASERLDVDGLVSAGGEEAWRGFPDGARVGHVHLQVGALAPAEAFYAGTLGLSVTCHYPGAVFLAANGYHHHLAANIWNSRGASVRDAPSTGLAEVEVVADAAWRDGIAARSGTAVTDGAAFTLRDPWGTAIGFVAR